MMAAYTVGIDLGTTNSVVAFSPIGGVEVGTFSVAQLVGPGEVAALEQLPSCLYLPRVEEFAQGATRLPWHDVPGYFLGRFAALHGTKVPGRTVLSAKSWLSYAGVDRTAPILPWGGAEDVERISPVEASARMLAHVRRAWDHEHPEAPLADQKVILTVPASFDEVARHLTTQAARDAGLSVRLLEEPQAAFYDFLRQHEANLIEAIGDARLILVVDLGGGTTDFTLVEVRHEEGRPPAIERIAVGDHLMLGGDNMDVTIGRHVEQQLTGSIGSIDASQWGSLVQSARLAKESLLGASPPNEVRVVLPGRGARLIGGGKSHPLTREEALSLLLDGFLPITAPDAVTERRARTALTEFSLPYAADPALSRHICGFLRRHAEGAAAAGARIYDGLPRPDAVLLNGGVFRSAAVRERLEALFDAWFDGDAVRFLPVGSLDLAVAQGAAYYGLVREGHGVRIGGGSARAYFVGVEAEAGEQRALCAVPRGMLEGSAHDVERVFRLRLGQPVSFPLFSSTGQARVRAGDVVEVDDELVSLPPLQTVLQAPPEVPVRLRAQLTEVGTLEISLCMTEEALSEWGLSFSTRAEAVEEVDVEVPPQDQRHRNLDAAKETVERYYGNKAKGLKPGAVKGLRRELERLLGDWDTWPIAVGRELFGALLVGSKRRRRSADHERVFFQLAGHCLRPGFGAPFDDWRIGELWPLFDAGVQYVKDKAVWAAWWIMWRRVAGGLSAEQQRGIFEAAWPWIDKSQGQKGPGPRPFGEDEMVRLLASLERLAAADKEAIGTWILRRLSKGVVRSWWPVGRLGSRQPFAGSAHDVVGRDVAEAWLRRVLEADWREADGAAFAAVQLSRRTGDRERDVGDKLRGKVLQRLEWGRSSEDWIGMVREVVPMSAQDEAQAFGDSLPVGLRLG